MKKHLLFIGIVAMLLFSAHAFAQQTYTMIASVSDLGELSSEVPIVLPALWDCK